MKQSKYISFCCPERYLFLFIILIEKHVFILKQKYPWTLTDLFNINTTQH